MAQQTGFSYQAGSPGPPVSRWPGLAAAPVAVGGVTVTFAEAEAALAALAVAGGVMVRQVLKAAGSPLAACDYRAAGAPFRALAAAELDAEPGMAGRGAAGRPETKRAFMAALVGALDAAGAAEPARHYAAGLDAAARAFGSDAEYAAAMARAAVAVREREHAARLRARLAAAARTAVLACDAARGGFSCAAVSACGTGDCRFAAGEMALLAVPAPPGRVPRPAGHVHAGQGFSASAALAALEAAVPFAVAVRAAGADAAAAVDAVRGTAA